MQLRERKRLREREGGAREQVSTMKWGGEKRGRREVKRN